MTACVPIIFLSPHLENTFLTFEVAHSLRVVEAAGHEVEQSEEAAAVNPNIDFVGLDRTSQALCPSGHLTETNFVTETYLNYSTATYHNRGK